MEEIRIKARAKINLSLDITGKREDGYHEISTIMQTLSLHDSLHIKKIYKPDYLKVVSNLPWLPDDERNLAYLAAKYLKDRFNIAEGIFINIEKAIPASAGLAGGSADCAAALLGIRNLFALPLDDEELGRLSLQFGADVPFCVMRGCAHATGIGEVLEPLGPLPYMHIVLAKPTVIVSTGEVFQNFDIANMGKRPDTQRILHGIANRDLTEICAGMANVLESVTAKRHPIIGELKDFLIEQGAKAAMMTGSGPTVFGIFAGRKAAEEAAKALKSTYRGFSNIFVTRPINY
jgi:4-diphosphocytidyl-2-C-methyl-D-erythritol kinase